MNPSRPVVRAAAVLIATLLPAIAAKAGSPVGPGPITLPPIVGKYDDRCLDRIDRKDERLAARQSRECRKPRGSRNGLPATDRPEPARR